MVSTSGVITAKEVGEATINVISQDDSGMKATCKVTVVKSTNTPGIVLSQTNINISRGSATYINPILTPTDLQVTYTSNDTTIATVNSSGEIIAKSVGNANITITAVIDTTITKTIYVTVNNPTNIEEYNDFNFKIYVNSGIQYIESNELIKSIQVISLNGVCLKDIKNVNQKTFSKNINRHQGKIVFVRVIYADKIEVRKIIVQ